jgi:hypothetical protein
LDDRGPVVVRERVSGHWKTSLALSFDRVMLRRLELVDGASWAVSVTGQPGGATTFGSMGPSVPTWSGVSGKGKGSACPEYRI